MSTKGVTIGKLISKEVIKDTQTMNRLNDIDPILGGKKRFKIGDNAYFVNVFNHGDLDITNPVILTRDDIVKRIKSGQDIIGLKLDAVGRLIEDHSSEHGSCDIQKPQSLEQYIKTCIDEQGMVVLTGVYSEDYNFEYTDTLINLAQAHMRKYNKNEYLYVDNVNDVVSYLDEFICKMYNGKISSYAIYYIESDIIVAWGKTECVAKDVAHKVSRGLLFDMEYDRVQGCVTDLLLGGAYRERVAPNYEALCLDQDNTLEIVDFISEISDTHKSGNMESDLFDGDYGSCESRSPYSLTIVSIDDNIREFYKNILKKKWKKSDEINKLKNIAKACKAAGIKPLDKEAVKEILEQVPKASKEQGFLQLCMCKTKTMNVEDMEVRKYYTMILMILKMIEKQEDKVGYCDRAFILKNLKIAVRLFKNKINIKSTNI